MDLNRYTNKAQAALLKGQQLANEYGHSSVDPLHILIGLLSQQDGVVPEIVAKIGARPQRCSPSFSRRSTTARAPTAATRRRDSAAPRPTR